MLTKTNHGINIKNFVLDLTSKWNEKIGSNGDRTHDLSRVKRTW